MNINLIIFLVISLVFIVIYAYFYFKKGKNNPTTYFINGYLGSLATLLYISHLVNITSHIQNKQDYLVVLFSSETTNIMLSIVYIIVFH